MVESKSPDKKKEEKRKGKRRRYLSEDEFRKLLEAGKVTPADRRAWEERRKEEKEE